MEGRINRWTAGLLLLMQTLALVFASNITSEETDNGKDQDLEAAAASYVSSYSTPNHFGNPYKPVVYSFSSNAGSYASTYPGVGLGPVDGKNATNVIHREIRCGDMYRKKCRNSRYRSYDGSCNNLDNPTWGMANTRYGRHLRPKYSDGIRSPPISVNGGELPLARLVSYTMFPNVDVNDPIWTLAAMQWGQIITHDMAMIDGTTQSKSHDTQCCTDDGQLVDDQYSNDQCYPMVVPYNDPVYSKANIRCLNFVRSTTDLDRDCSSRRKPAEQLTVVTHFLDLSLVYGSSKQVAQSLRAGSGGRLNVDIRDNREWPPPAANKSAMCDTVHPREVCYQTGDVRANQNPQLTIFQIILLREHNRVADYLAKLNPHWTDETIFQETRRIVIAEHQHISYYEWLPIFLGMEGTYGSKILYRTKDYVNDYNPNVKPHVMNEHSTAAFRYFHSLIAGYLNLVNKHQYYESSLRLSDHFNRPGIIEVDNNMDELTIGMCTQPQKGSDPFFDPEITQFLFRNGRPLGSDLRATDIQRDRDHGLASYNSYREFCGLPRANHFVDFMDYISPDDVRKLSELYASPDDVELTVGGSLERHVPGTLSGPTFLCIMQDQFYRTRVGDRHFYENGDPHVGFTIEQLTELRKASISRLLCDNGDNIETMQARGFEQVSVINPVLSCNHLPSVDLSLWKDFAPELAQHSSFPQFRK